MEFVSWWHYNTLPDTVIMMMKKRVVLASSNAKKAVEMQTLLAPLDIEIILQGVLGVDEAEEPYATFVENALTKARHAAAKTGLPAIADDSGLCVHALNGAPGVFSARYAGDPKSDARNNALLLERMQTVEDRRAYFYSVVVLLRQVDDPRPVIADGRWFGEILSAPQGEQGFGYDPLFWVPEQSKTAAELESAVKNQLSHRGIAIQRLLNALQSDPL